MVQSWGTWGDGVGTPATGAAAPDQAAPADYYAQTLTTFSPLIQSFASQMNDPIRQAAILRVKLQNAIDRGAPASEIRLLQAKLQAAERSTSLRVEGEQSGREWRNIGKIGAATGVVVGGSIALFILVKALRG